MLKNRIIPILLLKDGRMIKTIQFGSFRDVGDPVNAAKIYNAQRADELLILDISASTEGRKTLYDIIHQVAEECFMPLGVGGGIRTPEDIRKLLNIGADKVVINTAAVENPTFIKEASEKFGSSTIVLSIDVKKNKDGKHEVFIKSGKLATGLDPIEWAKKMEKAGAGEIMITSVDNEGKQNGLDINLVENIVKEVSVPVIASGGVGQLSDFQSAYNVGATAVAAASIFHFTDQSPIMARNYLTTNKANVRA